MDNKLLIEELTRIHQIMNNDKGIIIMESNLLMEAGIPTADLEKAFKGITGFFDRAATLEAEKVLSQTGEKFSVRLQRYITEKLVAGDVRALGNLIKNVSKSSPNFAEKFVNKNEKLLNDLVSKDVARGERIIKSSFGDNILKAYKDSKVIVNPTPKPRKPIVIKPPIVKPVELKNVSDFKRWLKDNNIRPNMPINKNYTTETEKLWDSYGEKYLEDTKLPTLLDNSVKIKQFQDWLDINHSDWIDVPLGKSEANGYGKYGPKTQEAFGRYNKEYYDSLTLYEKMESVEMETLDAKTLKWWETILSTDKTLSDKIQGAVDKFVQGRILSYQGEQKYIEDTFAQFKEALKDATKNFKQGDYSDLTMFRNINQRLSKLAAKNEGDLDFFYGKLEGILKQKLPNDSDDVSRLMESIKAQNPFRMGGFIGRGRWGWLTQYLNSTASGKLTGNFRKLFTLSKEQFKENFTDMLERVFYLGLIGSPKTHAEMGEYFEKELFIKLRTNWPKSFKDVMFGIPRFIGDNVGKGTLYAGLWGATNVGMPAFIAGVQTLWYFGNLWFGGNTEEFKGWKDAFQSYLKKYYDKHPAMNYFFPVHIYFGDLWNKFTEVNENAWADKYKGTTMEIGVNFAKKQYKEGKISPSAYVMALKVIIPNDGDIKLIDNTENGFKSFCKVAELTFESFTETKNPTTQVVTKVGKTKDEKEWYYLNAAKCFFDGVEIKKVQETEQDVKDKTDDLIAKATNTTLGFEEFCRENKFTIKTPYYTGGAGQTNEPDPNGAKTNNWYFDTKTNTFISY
jgi:hypothetical protein